VLGQRLASARLRGGTPKPSPKAQTMPAPGRRLIASDTEKQELLGQSQDVITVLPLQSDTVVHTLKNKGVN